MKKVNFRSLVLIACVLSITAGSLWARSDNGLETLRQTSKAFSAVAKKVTPAVVFIDVEKTVRQESGFSMPNNPFGDDFFDNFPFRGFPRQQPREYTQKGQGSGFIISDDGYILTNNHVVGEADKITVTLDDEREFEAKLIGTDPKSDVAVIKIEAEKLPCVPLGDSDALEIGEWVIAIGNPLGLDATVTVGVVSAKGRSVGIADYENFIQTDAAINPGNSGGPLLNLDGEAIGINTALMSRSGGYMGIGFAIPSNMAKSIKQQLMEKGSVTRGYLGVGKNPEGLTKELAEYFGLEQNEGVLIAQVFEDSPADKAGLKEGDVILELDGKLIKDFNKFRNTIAMTVPGTKVELLIYRDGKKIKKTVEIGSLPDEAVSNDLGLQVQELTEELASRFGYTGLTGVIVTEVDPDSNAAEAGIRPSSLIMSVDQKPVKNVDDFNETIAAARAKGKKDVLLRIRYGRVAEYRVLNIE